jgi:NADPH:quinone reductase-like Zn-dependent oxidoreductase
MTTSPATMTAAVCRRYGPPENVSLHILPVPTPRRGEVLIAVDAAGLSVGDARIRAARAPRGFGVITRLAFGLFGPRQPVLGREYAGRVAALGAGVSRFALGDAVFGITGGLRMGAHAQYLLAAEDGLILPRPATLDPNAAAAFFFGGLTAADFLLDQCALQRGARVLIVGATGAVGAAAVQIAKHHGAHVTALAGADNLALAHRLGADVALDYRKARPSGPFDIILDVQGALPDALDLLAPAGRLGLVTAGLGRMLAAQRPQRAPTGARICAGMVKETPAAMARLCDLHRAGGYDPLIGAVFALDDIVRAHTLADSGHKRGNTVIVTSAADIPPQA